MSILAKEHGVNVTILRRGTLFLSELLEWLCGFDNSGE